MKLRGFVHGVFLWKSQNIMQEFNNRFKFAIQLMNAQQWNRAEFELGHLQIAYPGNVNVLTALAELYYYKKNMRQVMAYLAKAQSGLNFE